MPQAERYDPTDDLLFDGGEDTEPEEEGSRLALLLVLALIVLGAFGGVVYLAYSQGVKQGREEAPRPVASATAPERAVAPPPSYKDLKVYKPPATDEELANEDAVPPPPTPVVPKPEARVAANSNGLTALPLRSNPKATSPASTSAQPSKPATQHQVATSAPPKEASGAPRAIAPVLAPPQTQPAETTPPPEKTVEQSPPPKPEVQAALTPSSTPPAAPAAMEAKAAGGFAAQIGAYKSEAEATASWRAYKSAHAAVANYEPDIVRVEIPGKGTWYRLRVGSFASATDANGLCSKLKGEGGSCFPAKR